MNMLGSLWFRWMARTLVITILFLSSGFQWAQAARIPSGTPLIIRLSETVSSKSHKMGNSVMGVVVNDVVVDGQLVVQSGASAIGKVTSANPSSIVGIPGSLSIRFESALAVNGASIPLMNGDINAKGNSNTAASVVVGLLCCILGFLITGGDAVVASGTTVNALTVGEITVD
jgi:hypothetical protein